MNTFRTESDTRHCSVPVQALQQVVQQARHKRLMLNAAARTGERIPQSLRSSHYRRPLMALRDRGHHVVDVEGDEELVQAMGYACCNASAAVSPRLASPLVPSAQPLS